MSSDSQQICFSIATCSSCYCPPKVNDQNNKNERRYSTSLQTCKTPVNLNNQNYDDSKIDEKSQSSNSYNLKDQRNFLKSTAMAIRKRTPQNSQSQLFRCRRKSMPGRLSNALVSTVIFALLLPLLLPLVSADCGCGARCEKYSEDLQCTRCCTTAVRRSVSLADYPPEALENNVIDNKNKIVGQSLQKRFGKTHQKVSTPLLERVSNFPGEKNMQYQRLSTLASLLAARKLNVKNTQNTYLTEIVKQLKRIQSNSHSNIKDTKQGGLDKPSHNSNQRSLLDFVSWLNQYLKIRRRR